MTKDEISEWVKASCLEAGISYAEASRRLGIPAGGVSKVVAQDRDLSAQEMFALAKITGTKVPWAAYALVPQVRYIIVRGEVGAGLWRDVTQTDFQDYEISAIIDPKYDDDAVFAFRISGESVNKIAGDGDHVVALKYDKAPRTLQSGDWVIAEASRGDLRERTVKRVKAADDGSWLLCPYSSDPRYQEPVEIGENGEDRVEVIAYVLDFLRKGTRF